MWILGSAAKDFLFLYLPGLLGIGIGLGFPAAGEESLLFGLFAFGLVDSGHVYTTAWRTWLHKEERRSSHRYWIVPLSIFAIFSLWFFFQIPGLWSFVVYATLYHHIRQVYGFSKWTQKLNQRQDPFTDRAVYFFSLVPFVAYHFRPGAFGNYYSENDLFLFPSPVIFKNLVWLYLLGGGTFLIREFLLWRRGIREPNRVLSLGIPALIYGYCFILGETLTQVLVPLLFFHGISYVAVMEQSLRRTRSSFQKPYLAAGVLLVTALTLGPIEAIFEEDIVRRSVDVSLIPASILVGIFLTPLFSHYVFDAFIWKRGHREASRIFSPEEVKGP